MTKFLLILIVTNCFGQIPGNGATDNDGNVYNSVIIGTQEWLVEDLNTTTFQNGDAILHVTPNSEWPSSSVPRWCYYQNDMAYAASHGKLYNWAAVNDSRSIAPEGWHIPNDSDWQILANFLGGNQVAGGKMKSSPLWDAPNLGATNSSGFNGLPGAGRYYDGVFVSTVYYGQGGVWWSSSSNGNGIASSYSLHYDSNSLSSYSITPSTAGYSVRCIKNNPLHSSDFDETRLKLFPNPTSDEVTLALKPGKYTVHVYNLMGQEIINKEVVNELVMSLAIFGKGIYILKCYDSLDKLTVIKKIIVK